MPSEIPSDDPTRPAARDDRGSFVIIAASSYVAYAIDGTPAHLARLDRDPDGTITLRPVGEPFARLDLAVDAGRWRAERDAYAATAQYECVHCATPITLINGEWVGMDYTTPGGGQTACPPNPDSPRVDVHVPQRRTPTRPDRHPSQPAGDEATAAATTDTEVCDWFAVYRTEPEAVWTIGALAATDGPLRLGIAALGGGTMGRRYTNNGWIYGLWYGDQLYRCGADVRSGGTGHTHREVAVLLAERLTDNDDLDAGIRARLAAWLDEQPAKPDLP